MPQVDLENLVSACAGGSCDRKIACETLTDDDIHVVNPSDQLDFPPESFWLSKDAELDWFSRNAFYERKDSTKGNANSGNLNPSSNSNSQRFSHNLKSKASIIGLPKTQKTTYVDSKCRRNAKPGNTRLFPKRSGSTSKNGQMIEPSSPKVSCMGRVRSKRDLRRRRSQKKSFEPPVGETKPYRNRKFGFFANFRAIFRSGCREKPVEISPANQTPPGKRSARDMHDIRNRLPESEINAPSTEITPRNSFGSEAPGLGAMKHFVSGRRSESWGSAVEI